MMKVAHIMDHFIPRNLSLIYENIASMSSHGVDSTVYCLKRVNEESFPYSNCFAFHSLRFTKKNLFRLVARLKRTSDGCAYWAPIIKGKEPDLIHSHFIWMGKDGIWLKRKLQIPLVLSLYGEDEIKINNVQRNGTIREIFQQCDVIIAVSNYVAERAVALGAQEIKVKVVHPGVDCNFYRPMASTSKNDSIKIGMASRLELVKGVDLFIGAIGILNSKGYKIKAKIAGSGSQEQTIRELIKSHALSSVVELCGWVDQSRMPQFLSELDIFVQPSKIMENGITEAASRSILEAQACEVPVIATRTGGIPEMLSDGVTGILVAPNDKLALADAIEKLCIDDKLRKTMGREGRAYIKKFFNIEAKSKEIVDIYSKSINEQQNV